MGNVHKGAFTDERVVKQSFEALVEKYTELDDRVTIAKLKSVCNRRGLLVSARDFEEFIDTTENPEQDIKHKLRDLYDCQRLKILHDIELKEFQQPINCCNITSLAYAFSVITSKQVTVNDIFHIARLDGHFVTCDGLTLAETYDIACIVADHLQDIFVEVYHFDEGVVDFNGFKAALIDDMVSTNDILVCNFSVRIAHQLPAGGGHFALVGCVDMCEDKPDDLIVTISDVHPMKYGKSWTCPASRLFEAMQNKDTASMRARGMIRIGLKSCERGIPSMIKALKAVCFCDPNESLVQKQWLERYSKWLPTDSFRMVLNMSGVTAAGLAITGLVGKQDDSIIGPDAIMRALKLDYTEVLRHPATVSDMLMYINYYCSLNSLNISAEDKSFDDKDSAWNYLLDHVGPDHNTVALVLLDLNIALQTPVKVVDPKSEAAKLSHFAVNWAVLVRANDATKRLTIADPSSRITTRLWEIDVDVLWASMQAMNISSMVFVSKEV